MATFLIPRKINNRAAIMLREQTYNAFSKADFILFPLSIVKIKFSKYSFVLLFNIKYFFASGEQLYNSLEASLSFLYFPLTIPLRSVYAFGSYESWLKRIFNALSSIKSVTNCDISINFFIY